MAAKGAAGADVAAVDAAAFAAATRDLREVGGHATWSVSSYKGSFSVDHLRDDDLTTYWQTRLATSPGTSLGRSDGIQPHQINIQFRSPVQLASVALYLDARPDESYTPNRILVRAGSTFHDLQDVGPFDLGEASGWCLLPMADAHGRPVRAHIVQVVVVSNLQNGRDTHVRQVKIFAPLAGVMDPTARPFSSAVFRQQEVLR